MEQQRLFAWSETSGLLDLDAANQKKVLESNTFVLHRTTVLDLLVQVQYLFKEFQQHQEKRDGLKPVSDPDGILERPEQDAAQANFLLPPRRRDFVKKAMRALRDGAKDTAQRLQWVHFDKPAFELLLTRFSALNDNMTDILDAKMQKEIHHTVQDTNRGVLQLHHRMADLNRLVMALNLKLESTAAPTTNVTPLSVAQKAANASGLQLLSQLAKFKAFNESIESDKERSSPWDNAAATQLGLGKPGERSDLMLDRSLIQLSMEEEEEKESNASRCDAFLRMPNGDRKKVWIEWKDYDPQRPTDPSPPKEVIIERVRKLSALLNHTPKPEAFRTPHCLGFFDKASPSPNRSADSSDSDSDGEDIRNLRLGLVFERPQDVGLHASLPPISLRELLASGAKPSVTDRVALAHAVSECLLYLHAVNWLHKGFRSSNIVFFKSATATSKRPDEGVDYSKPYLAGFDFSRPARPDEMTDIPGADAVHDLYRHPSAQSQSQRARRVRFRKSFDVYALGVVLFEIAHWRPVEEVLNQPRSALRVRFQLLTTDSLAALGAACGRIYQEAARRCVSGGADLGLTDGEDETDDGVAAKLGMRFYEDVVKRLGEVKI
jgi:hypothetical protein